MKWIILFNALISITACKNGGEVPQNKTEVSTDSSKNAITASTEKDSLYTKYDCSFERTLAKKNIPQLAKDIYFRKEWNLNNQDVLFAMLDSLNAKDTASRTFYFKIVTLTYEKADGAYAEGLGSAGKSYVEEHTLEFISHFDHKGCFTYIDLETWAGIVLLDFSITFDIEKDNNSLKSYIRKLKQNCHSFTSNQKSNLDRFCNILMEESKKIHRNTE